VATGGAEKEDERQDHYEGQRLKQEHFLESENAGLKRDPIGERLDGRLSRAHAHVCYLFLGAGVGGGPESGAAGGGGIAAGTAAAGPGS
jgi:hypothetical protein